LRVRHSEQRLRTTIMSRREGPDCFIRDLSPDFVKCVDLYQTEITRSARHQGGGFDFGSAMGVAAARASRRTGLEFVGISSMSRAESVSVIMLETSVQVSGIDRVLRSEISTRSMS